MREQALVVSAMLADAGCMTFHDLVEDAPTRAVVVSRFLALLELYRRGTVEFEQDDALGTLSITWTGGDGSVDIDVDDYTGADDADSSLRDDPMSSEGEGVDD